MPTNEEREEWRRNQQAGETLTQRVHRELQRQGLVQGLQPVHAAQPTKAAARISWEGATGIHFRFPFGLGDCLMLAVVLRHLARWNQALNLEVNCAPGCAPIFRGVCRASDSATKHFRFVELPAARQPVTIDTFNQPYKSFASHPSTSAEHFIVDALGREPESDLASYRIDSLPKEAERADKYVREISAADAPLAIVQRAGASSAGFKDIPIDSAWRIVDRLIGAGYRVIVLDWTGADPLAHRPDVANPGSGHWLWSGDALSGAGTLAALLSRTSIFVGIDSGPSKLAAAAGAKCFFVWTKHHPINYCAPMQNVTHLLPAGHEQLACGDWAECRDYFQAHYRHETYKAIATVADHISP